MKVTVPMTIIAVVCSSALILTGLAYSAELTVEDNRVETTTVYCTLKTTTSSTITYVAGEDSSTIKFGGSDSCEIIYTENNGNGGAFLVFDFYGSGSDLEGSTLKILDSTGMSVIGSHAFDGPSDGAYHAVIGGFPVEIDSVTGSTSFSFKAQIFSSSPGSGSLVMNVTAYPVGA